MENENNSDKKPRIQKSPKNFLHKNFKQAGAELCQAQFKLSLIWA